MNKRLLIIIATSVITFCCLLSMWLYALYTPAVSQEGGYTYYLRPGASKRVVINDLSQAGIVKGSLVFSIYIYLHKNEQLKTGEYLFPKGSTLVSIWNQISHGSGLIQHPFMIIPGWTFAQLRNVMAQAPGLRHQTAGMNDRQIMTLLGHPELSPEGQFYPETYFYTRDMTDLAMLKRAFDLMQIHLRDAWDKRAPGLPYKTSYEALTAASLIEKEAYLNSERPLIAGVLVNRIKKDMLLQIDATVIYGLGPKYDGKIHKADLKQDTVYNTYVHKGLPPTPIAMPGQSSLNAALHPQFHDFYYYVAKGDGSHQFSRTLREHNTAVHSVIKLRTGFFNETVVRRHMQNIINSFRSHAWYEASLSAWKE